MAHNYFVSYDLIAPGQHYDRVIEAIQQTGDWAKIQKSLFYVKSPLALLDFTAHVWKAMDENDTLIVIDATGNDCASHNVEPAAVQQMRDLWDL